MVTNMVFNHAYLSTLKYKSKVEKCGLQSKSTDFLKHVCTDSREKNVLRFYFDTVELRLYVANHHSFSVVNRDVDCKVGVMLTDLVQVFICLQVAAARFIQLQYYQLFKLCRLMRNRNSSRIFS